MAGKAGALDPSARETMDAVDAEWEAAAEAIGAWLARAPAE